jgi:crotonobetainyl-CoA:carnitine CoA-transferase CaiB-like acyl-CoA transferase
MGGLMSITGLPGQGPVRVGIPIADLTAGLFCALGIMVALLEREQSGEGQWVNTSLLQAQIFMLDFQAARWTIGHEVPKQAGTIIRPRSQPACSRPPTATSTSPLPAAKSGTFLPRAGCRSDDAEARIPDDEIALAEPQSAQR